jgi:peptide/nickel transport system ATP-binding protein
MVDFEMTSKSGSAPVPHVDTSGGELILDVRGLGVSFHQTTPVRVLEDISFHIKSGRTLGIVGESGSGKSVTAMTLMRLIDSAVIDAGTAFFSAGDGERKNLLELNDSSLRSLRGNEIAMVFQEPMTSLNPVYTCGDQVAETLMLHKGLKRRDAQDEVIRLFQRVKLPRPKEMSASYPHQLSGGQKQRVMIAMAIACKPRLLIADEPTTALDVTVQSAILDLLRELQAETGMAMIFITHDLGVVKRIADDVLVMYRGKSVEYGPVANVLDNPAHAYTRGLMACRPSVNMHLQRLPVMSDFMNADGSVAKTQEEYSSITEAPAALGLSKEDLSLLTVNGLEVTFGGKRRLFGRDEPGVHAVDRISFEVFQGETLGLVGESGCGKTTLGRALLRLMEPGSGSIRYRGQEIRSMGKEEMRATRRKMQLIFQDPYSSLNPRLTVGQTLMEPMEVHGLYANRKLRFQKTLELLDAVGLKEEYVHRYPHQFSGGQRQRIGIARALAVEPELIICDESVSALDVSVQAQVLNLLNDLKKQRGLTYIFISHDLSVVRFMSDRIMVMNRGRIEEMGDARQVYEQPSSIYTRSLIDAIPR